MRCSRAVLEEIFDKQEMMVLRRVDLEMYLADSRQQQAERHYEAIALEVIIIEDEDNSVTEGHVALRRMPLAPATHMMSQIPAMNC